MRIAVEFISDKEITLPWNYLDWLRGMLYSVMERGIPQVSQLVHEYGFSGGGKRYKLITFSLLYPHKYEMTADGLKVKGMMRWWVSSPLEPIIEAVALGLLSEPEVDLGTEKVKIQRVEVVLPPRFAETVTFKTISPICVSTGRREGEKFEKVFLSPDDREFARVLNDNLKRKAEVVYGKLPEGEVEFSFSDGAESKLMTVSRTQVRCWMLTFRAQGPKDLLRVGYEAGFGERNAQGFGMVEVAKTQRKRR